MVRVCPAAITLAACLVTACKSTTPHDPLARDAPSPRPAWTTVPHFVTPRTEGGVVLAGVGVETIEGFGARCVETRFAVERATSKARVGLAKLVALGTSTISGATATAETSSTGATTIRATISGSERRHGWFDEQGHVFVLVALDSPATAATHYPAKLRLEIPLEGQNPTEIPARIQEFNRRQLEIAGVCADPHRRAGHPCCGPTNAFCSDPTRFDHRPTEDTCACGDSAPCLHDFRCEIRGGAHRCLCRGPVCPCGDLKCRDGQTCEDGRCY